MDIYVLDSTFNRIDIIDEYESCIWNIKYFDVSDFELYISASCENIKLLKHNNYLVRDKDVVAGCMHNVMIIEKIVTQSDVENGDYLIITGRDLRSIAGRRIIWPQTILNEPVEAAMRTLLYYNIINPSIESRKIDNVTFGELEVSTDVINQQVTGDNLQEYITKTLTIYGIGWRCCVNENKEIVFDFYKGVDRSINQSDNPRVVFSPDNENILNCDYSMDYTDYKNVAVVAGEGEGINRRNITLNVYHGMDRYELFVDARNVSSNDGEISDTDYLTMLSREGTTKLKEHTKVEEFEGEIEPNNMYVYGVDYNLGDIVTITNLYEVTANPRIIGVIESFSNEGESIIPTFSAWI